MRVQSSGREWLCENRISWRLRQTSLTHILSACVWPWRRSVCHYSFLFVIIIIVVLLLLLLLLLYFGRTCSRHVIHSLMERNDTHYTPHCRSRSIVSVGSVPRRYIFIISGEHINYKPALNLRSTWFFSIIYLFFWTVLVKKLFVVASAVSHFEIVTIIVCVHIVVLIKITLMYIRTY